MSTMFVNFILLRKVSETNFDSNLVELRILMSFYFYSGHASWGQVGGKGNWK